jgi:gamma-glutamylcyclotransferase (GGCT)/AIG2-like uncharacterized protein YtfP
MRFFFYGTLRDAAVREAVLGRARARALSLQPATLRDWRCAFMRGRTYPVVVPSRGDDVAGLLAGAVDREGYRRLTAFESDEYVERDATVVTADGMSHRARIYAAGARARIGAAPWDFDAWGRDHRAAFLRRIAAMRF